MSERAIDIARRRAKKAADAAVLAFDESIAADHAKHFAVIKDLTPEAALQVIPPLGWEPSLVTGRCRCKICQAVRKGGKK